VRVGLLTGGGDCPGLNAAIRAVVKHGIGKYGHSIIGFRNGWRGVVDGYVQPLTRADVRNVLPVGGTLLGTARFHPHEDDGGLEAVRATLGAERIEALICIGGDGTLHAASKVAETGIKIVGIPKTIDNDVAGTDLSIGFHTAVNIATEAIDRVHTTAESHNRVMVVEVMGRHAGWIALNAGIAGGAELVLAPEEPFDIDKIVKFLKHRHRVHANFSIIVVAEGALPAEGTSMSYEAPVGPFGAIVAGAIGERVAALTAEKTKLERDDGELAGLVKSRESVAGQIDALRKEKSAADASVAESETVHRDLDAKSAQVVELQAELGKLPAGFDEKRFRELQQLRESLQPVRERAAALNGELERLPKVESEFTELSARFESKNREIAQSEKTLSEIGFSESDHERLTLDYEAASAQLNAALVTVEKQRGEVNTATAILANNEREETAYKARVEGLSVKRSERLHLEVLAQAFDKLRAELNDRIRPELESIASELLSEMTDGRYNTLEINDSYSAVIRDDGELKPVISGGEDDIVNLALRLAVSQMIADRAGQSFSLLVLDEVFGSLDDVRRDNVVALLQNLKNRFEQIIVITNVESINDAVDNCLWVAFDEKTKTSRLIDRSIEIEPTPAGVFP